MLYIMIFLLLLLLTYRYDYCNSIKGRTLWTVIVWLILILVAGLRYRIGTDSIRYEVYFVRDYPPIYDLESSDFENSRFSPFYIILNSIVKTFTSDFMVFQFVHATIVCTTIVLFFKKNPRHFFLAMTLFCVFLYLTLLTEVLRESLAVCVFLWSWTYFKNRNWILWYAMSFIAVMFHTSAVMMFVLPLICVPGIRQLFIFGKRTIVVCVVVGIIGVAVQMMFFKYVQAIAITENLAERAEVYSKSELGVSNLNVNGIFGQIVRYIAYPVIALYYIHKAHRQLNNSKESGSFDNIEAFTLMCVYIAIMSMSISIIERYTNYFMPFAILTISKFAFSDVVILSKPVRFKFIYWLMFFLPMMFAHVHITYMHSANTSGTLKAYMPYYPYSSRIEMSKDMNREKCYRYLRAW